METKFSLIAGVAFFSLTLASCSQDTEVTAEPDRSEIRSSQAVNDLTKQLKDYDSRFTYDNTENLRL